MLPFLEWIVFLCVLQTTQSFSLIDRICKINSSFDRCASRAKQGDTNNGTHSKWIRADELSEEDQKFLRLARQTGDDPVEPAIVIYCIWAFDDPWIRKLFTNSQWATNKNDKSCKKLKTEYDQVCFTPPPPQAFQETKEFCDAFVETCPETLKTNLFTHLTELHVDYTAYCKKSKERFQYVCPKPFRFKTYAEQAVEFCIRYKDRCPDAVLPDEPLPFKKEDETHIYIREIQSLCKNLYRGARTYCYHPELLKYPKYAIPCALYKMQCIDVYTRVIYG